MYGSISLCGSGFYVPEQVIKNSEEKIIKLTGVLERRKVEEGKTSSDLAFEASKKAISKANIFLRPTSAQQK